MTPEELRTARKHLCLTQRQLAEALRLGLDGKRSVQRWESGERPISGPVAVAVELMERKPMIGGSNCPTCWQFRLTGPCTHMTRKRVINTETLDVLGTLEMPASITSTGDLIVECLASDGVPFATVHLCNRKTSDSAFVEHCVATQEPVEFWRNVRGFSEVP